MNLLIIGGGGREHALAWKVRQSPLADQVWVAPGNGGTAREPGIENVDIDAEDIPRLITFARDHGVELTIVGPEAPLVAGVVDAFAAAGLRCFGPTAAAAQLEGSKQFTKDFLARHNIPTANYQSFSDQASAFKYLEAIANGAGSRSPFPLVIKADGLAAGKGVVIAETLDSARATVQAMLSDGQFGAAGQRVVIEEFLTGEEASFIALVDGETIVPLASSQDHKARDDGDRGPNTGGMGAYSPAPVVTAELHERIMAEVMRPSVRGLAVEGLYYRGFLYAGLMIGEDGVPRVLEFNCRLGDPEAQPLLMRLQSDLVQLCLDACDGHLDENQLAWDPRVALGVVMAAAGYPDSPRKGDEIQGLETADTAECKVFHAGTRVQKGKTLTSGGRVLCVTALGPDIAKAQELAYAGVARIQFHGGFYRRDIGHRALGR
ncbi:phosphoribosylamine--glycine ligase [Thiorhodovibrio frisius]|uniref:Phosphoribosylamine--glycine ligase n=1 Tax=Thiorhodovibrio frisius TaxID=631362 RepID=H8YYG4_9GAMM|nr:phosphoribosylamine--glycine ligase [Thiorhodovibrio frisius]EIC23490.1 phosphoribosylamine--glycine ligase [Thiorhodovibrio frisius]WPL23423.1 Phosphoribosylamine--glycine ligase [Thiorhodovibrio frisius]